MERRTEPQILNLLQRRNFSLPSVKVLYNIEKTCGKVSCENKIRIAQGTYVKACMRGENRDCVEKGYLGIGR